MLNDSYKKCPVETPRGVNVRPGGSRSQTKSTHTVLYNRILKGGVVIPLIFPKVP